jgi:hypothetical protein
LAFLIAARIMAIITGICEVCGKFKKIRNSKYLIKEIMQRGTSLYVIPVTESE